MREQNPAITLYEQYRNIISWRGERWVVKMRSDFQRFMARTPDTPRLTSQEVEDRIIDAARFHSRYQVVPVNYRMSLRIMGLSDAHLADDRLYDDLDDWEPIIQLQMSGRGYATALFTIWPDGKFQFDQPPSKWYRAMPDFVTFLRTGYAAGRRVWLVHSPSMGVNYRGWYSLLEKDWTNPVPYVRNYDLIEGVFYRIVPAENGHWKFQGVPSQDIVTHEILLEEGYRVAEKRYARYRRAYERETTAWRKRHMIAMYVPRQGLITDDEAVARFAQSMRVYEPS